MPGPTNLTDRIAQLRERKGGSPILRSQLPAEPPSPVRAKRPPAERKMATDYFVVFSYGLLVVALCAQLALLLWLDIS